MSLLSRLLGGSHTTTADELPALVAATAVDHGATGAVVYLVDYDQEHLVPMDGGARAAVPVEGSLAGRAFTDVRPVSTGDRPGSVWFPLLDGSNRLGVLEVLGPAGPTPAEDPDLADLASVVAQLVVSRAGVGDVIERTRRMAPMALAAEIQWNLLPPLTFSADAVRLSGSLVPAQEIAGDSFDYAVNDRVAHVALFDAMGHGLQASLLASIALGAYRNGRRSGLDLSDRVRSIDKFVESQFDTAFVTGIVGELDLVTGTYRYVSCGHHAGLLVRNGKVVKELDASHNLPLGLQDEKPQIAEERLEPDDRVLLYSDGVTEARDAEGEFFGTERLVDSIARASSAGMPPAETMRRLVKGILAHQAGDLQDDATAVLLEWRGSEPPDPATP